MVTKTRKLSGKPKTAYDTSSSDSLIAVILYEGERFSLRSQWYPDLYNKYINRKNINIDFSGVKTQAGIEKLRRQFAERFADAPTPEQITSAKKANDIANKNKTNAFLIRDFARNITYDLADAGADPHISDERYLQIVDYIKSAVRALAEGKNINSIYETNLSPTRRFFNKVIGKDPLKNIKYMLNECGWGNHVANIPRESLLSLIASIPKERIQSRVLGYNGAIDKYMEYFNKMARKNMDIADKKNNTLTILLFKNKIRVDGMRTFDILAQQHMDKLKKEKNNRDAAVLKEAAKTINQQHVSTPQRKTPLYPTRDTELERRMTGGRK